MPVTFTRAPSTGFSRHERHLQRGQVDDVRDLVLGEDALDARRVGDVAADEVDRVDLGGVPISRAAEVVAEIEGDHAGALADERDEVHAPMQPRAPVTNQRVNIVVDGHDLGVELHRRAALLVRAVAGALDPAERDVDVCAGGLRVDVQDPGLELVDEPLAVASSS